MAQEVHYRKKGDNPFTVRTRLIYTADDFCKAVTGYDFNQLLERASKSLDLLAKKDSKGQETSADKFVDRYFSFLDCKFEFPLVSDSDDMLYLAFLKLRGHERFCHSDPKWHKPLRDYWEPAYEEVENVFRAKDSKKFRKSICRLVDMILHN